MLAQIELINAQVPVIDVSINGLINEAKPGLSLGGLFKCVACRS
jgi:hypothetical protein